MHTFSAWHVAGSTRLFSNLSFCNSFLSDDPLYLQLCHGPRFCFFCVLFKCRNSLLSMSLIISARRTAASTSRARLNRARFRCCPFLVVFSQVFCHSICMAAQRFMLLSSVDLVLLSSLLSPFIGCLPFRRICWRRSTCERLSFFKIFSPF